MGNDATEAGKIACAHGAPSVPDPRRPRSRPVLWLFGVRRGNAYVDLNGIDVIVIGTLLSVVARNAYRREQPWARWLMWSDRAGYG